MGTPAVDRYMNDLMRVYRYRALMDRAQLSPSLASGVGSSAPSAMQLAMDAMRATAPAATVSPSAGGEKKDNGSLLKTLFHIAAPVTAWGPKALDSGPGKAVLDILSRPAYAVGSAMQNDKEQSQAAVPTDKTNLTVEEARKMMEQGSSSEGDLKAFWEGLSGKNKVLPSQATFGTPTQEEAGNKNWIEKIGDFSRRLAVDVASDPTSFITPGAGTFGRAGAKAGEAIVAAEKAVPVEGRIISDAEKVLPAAPERLALPVGSPAPNPARFTVGSTGVADKLNPVALADEMTARAISDAVAAMPKRAYVGSIDPVYKTIVDKSTERVPVKVTEDIQVPIEQAAPVAKTSNPQGLAHLRAVKMSILNSPDYKVQGRYSVSELLSVAQKSPERAKDIERMIDAEVKNVVRSKDYSALPDVIRLLTSEGKSGSVGLTVEQAAKLFREGKVPKALTNYDKEGAQAFADAFPLHSAEDLSRVFLRNAKGENVSIKKYFEDLGIPLTQIDQTGAEKLLSKVKAKTGSKLTFDGFPEALGPATKTVTRTKTVFKEVVKETTRTERLSRAESVAWALTHTERGLSAADIKYLRASRNPEQFAKRVGEINARTVLGNFKTLQDVIDARKAGLIPDQAWDKLLGIVGAKSEKDLLEKAQKALKVAKPPASPKFEDFVTGNEKISVVTTKQGSIWDSVDSVDTLIQKVSEGDLSAVAHPVPELTGQVYLDALAGLDTGILRNLVDPQDISKYPFLSGRVKAKRTHQTQGVGRGRNLHGWHKISQAETFASIVRKVSADTAKRGLKGKELSQWIKLRPEVMFSRVMDAYLLSEAALRAKGVKLIAGKDNSGLLLSLGDVLTAMDPAIVKRFLFGVGRGTGRGNNLHPTRFVDIAEAYVRSALAGNDLSVAREMSLVTLRALDKTERLATTGKSGATEFLDAMEKALPDILQRVNANYAEESIKIGESVKSMTDKVINDVISTFTDPTKSAGDALNALMGSQSEMSKIGRAVKAPTEAYPVAKTILDSELTRSGLKAGDLAEADLAKKVSAAPSPAKAAEEGTKQQASRAAEAIKGVEETDLSELADIQMQAGIFRANVPLLDKVYTLKGIMGRSFMAHYGHNDFHFIVHQEHNVQQTFARMHRQLMQDTWNTAKAAFGDMATEKIQSVWKVLQANPNGFEFADEGTQAVYDAMRNSTDILFSGDRGSMAARNGLFPEHLNRIMEMYGVPKEYRFKEGVPMAQQPNAWSSWLEVKDPLDLLDKVHASYQRAVMETTVARDFSRRWGSATPVPGLVKIVDTKGRSVIGGFIDTRLYYPKDIVDQIPHIDRFLKESVKPSPALLRMYDEVLHAWKAGVTIYRPGHHVRNLVGDIGLSFLAGVTNPKHFKSATRIMSGRADAYREWDALKALQDGFGTSKISLGKTTKYRVGRSSVDLTDDAIWRAAFDQGLLPDYNTLEDIMFNTEQSFTGLNKIKPFGGRVQKVAGGISQTRDHWVRLAHFVHELEANGPKAKNLQELFETSGRTVRKWHPDGSDLTAFERKTMRRLIPFYSWFRKAIPLVVEAAVLRPGRTLAMPKAMQDLAITMGIDPESLADPFPQNLLLPDWLTNNILGPQFESGGNLYGINPGDPVSDLGSSFLGGDAGNDVMGGVTPAIRMPAELATGNSWGTGTPIKDTTEYLGQNIPGISILQNITNRDVLGGMGPTVNAQRGYEGNWDPVALINTLTGAGITNYTKPNYLKSGQLEYRDKLRNGG